MIRRLQLLMLILVVSSGVACANETKRKGGCEEFKFEDGVRVYMRPGEVTALHAKHESFAPRNIISAELKVPSSERFEGVKKVHVSALFRKLESMDDVKCQVLADTGLTRCYMRLPDGPLQVSATVVQDDSIHLPSLMRDIALQVKLTALNCHSPK